VPFCTSNFKKSSINKEKNQLGYLCIPKELFKYKPDITILIKKRERAKDSCSQIKRRRKSIKKSLL
jgi:hypothetical protein